MNISTQLKEIRGKLELSQADFAKRIGVKQSYYSAMERGEKQASTMILDKLISEVGISANWLYNKQGGMFNELSALDPNIADRVKTYNRDPGRQLNVFVRKRNADKEFYHSCSETDIDALLSAEIEQLKDAYTAYSQLLNTLPEIKAPKFIVRKFHLSEAWKTFKEFLASTDESFNEDHAHLADQKLVKIFKIETYQSQTEHLYDGLRQAIHYISNYSDFFNDIDKDQDDAHEN